MIPLRRQIEFATGILPPTPPSTRTIIQALRMTYRAPVALVVFLLVASSCGEGEASSKLRASSAHPAASPILESPARTTSPSPSPAPALSPASHPMPDSPSDAPVAARETSVRVPNQLGRIPILEYHLIGDKDGRWMVERGRFRRQLELLYERGYRPITVAELVDGKIDLPAGQSPVVVTFDDASPSQFGYVERNGQLEVDPNSAVGIWLSFHAAHPDWGNKAVFCMLSGAAAGRSFFGDKGIEGQKSEWRMKKVRFLAEQGFELCNHTLWHANLGHIGDNLVREQIARGALAIDSAVSGYRVRTFALPLGVWPKNRGLASAGSWRDPKSGRETHYKNDAVLMVAGGAARSPFDPQFDPQRLPRVQVFGNELERVLDQLDQTRTRYVAGGSVPKRSASSVRRAASVSVKSSAVVPVDEAAASLEHGR